MKHNNPQNSVFFSENLGKVSENPRKVPENLGNVLQNPREVFSKFREVFPENLGKSDSVFLGSLFEFEIEVIVDGD